MEVHKLFVEYDQLLIRELKSTLDENGSAVANVSFFPLLVFFSLICYMLILNFSKLFQVVKKPTFNLNDIFPKPENSEPPKSETSMSESFPLGAWMAESISKDKEEENVRLMI